MSTNKGLDMGNVIYIHNDFSFRCKEEQSSIIRRKMDGVSELHVK